MTELVISRVHWGKSNVSPWVTFRNQTEQEAWARAVRVAFRERGLGPPKIDRSFIWHTADSILKAARDHAANHGGPIEHRFHDTEPRRVGLHGDEWRSRASCSCGWLSNVVAFGGKLRCVETAKKRHDEHVVKWVRPDEHVSEAKADTAKVQFPKVTAKRGGIRYHGGTPDAVFFKDHTNDTNTPTEGAPVTTLTRKAVLAAELSRLQEEMAKLAALPDEPTSSDQDGALVVWWVMRFRDGNGGAQSRNYTYAAVKAGPLWYTTGPRAPKGYTWDELVDWVSREGADPGAWEDEGEIVAPQLWLANGYEPVV